MDWYIRDIIIYGDGGDIRRLEFRPGVNIITGDSQTGKSALTAIVDYCLGAGEYEVPVGVIREYARWYAVRLQTPGEQIFLARKEPGGRNSSDVMHIVVRPEVPIPTIDELTGNTNRRAVIDELSRRLGMMEQSLAESGYDKTLTEPPTVRNVAPFLYQPQGVIANKDQLFYKTDAERHREHRQRLQRIFPYILGAVNAEYFQLKGDLDTARRQLRQQEHALAERESLAAEGLSIARSLLDRAHSLGLLGHNTSLSESQSPDDTSAVSDSTVIRTRLADLAATASSSPFLQPAVAGDPDRISALSARSRSLRTEIAALRRRLGEVRELSQEATGFVGALGLQRNRLRAVSLLPSSDISDPTCPMCSQQIQGIVPSAEHVRAVFREVQTELDGMSAVGPALAERLEELQAAIGDRQAALVQVESELAQWYRVQADMDSADTAWVEQQRFIGEVRFYLNHTPGASEDTADLRRRVTEMRHRVARLEEAIESFDPSDRQEAALIAIAQVMTDLGKRFRLEQPDATLRLDIKRLTVVRTPPGAKPERLNEIGSGENWVAYHLCALFALHTYFFRVNSPVPAFLFLDQPSQIYFPQEQMKEQSGGDMRERTDWDAVRNIYEMIFSSVRALENRLQVIIVDHADLQSPPEFQEAVRYRWRNGQKLI